MRVILSALFLSTLFCWADLKTGKFDVTDIGHSWYQHDQFGVFYDDNDSNWCYHIDHGWIYVDEWNDNGTWMYIPLNAKADDKTFRYYDNDFIESGFGYFMEVATDFDLEDIAVPFGWIWSSKSNYPFIYNYEMKEWLYFNSKLRNHQYFSYFANTYINDSEIRKTIWNQDIWLIAMDWMGFEYVLNSTPATESSNSTPEPTSNDHFVAGKTIIKVPRFEIKSNSKWSYLITKLEEINSMTLMSINREVYRISESNNIIDIEIDTISNLASSLETESFDKTDGAVETVKTNQSDDEYQTHANTLDASDYGAITIIKADQLDLEVGDRFKISNVKTENQLTEVMIGY